MSSKKPERMCIACRTMMDKTELFRIVMSPEGEISIDRNGKKPGRGAYLCKSELCYKNALKSKALSRAFKAPISGEILQSMEVLYGSNS
ncbi:MAG: YlxR family protein [Oscillospiraceae bacterium]|nr:YlxR family protein [Oscillospiraceae bacterium]MCL2278756.1 YlxR family protein [Oscillospiraceae bacterium]